MVSATAWMDRKVVMVISTNCQHSSDGAVHRNKRDGSSLEVPCPASIISCNQFMGGVDCGDQLRCYYCCRSRSRKFYKYIFSFSLMWQSQMPSFSWSHLADLAPSRISNPFDYSSPRCWLVSTAVVAIVLMEGLSSTLFHFVTSPSGWTMTCSDRPRHPRGPCALHCDTHHLCVLSTWYCRECGEWLCRTGDPSSDCFLQWNTRLHVWLYMNLVTLLSCCPYLLSVHCSLVWDNIPINHDTLRAKCSSQPYWQLKCSRLREGRKLAFHAQTVAQVSLNFSTWLVDSTPKN